VGQLPLGLSLKPHTSFESFVGGSNSAALEHVRAVACGQRAESVWLYGAPGTGKSHLLAAACRAASEKELRAISLSADGAAEPSMLSHLDDIDVVAIVDVDRFAGIDDWERALFSLFNARLQRGGLLVTAASPPRACGFTLADLVSRAGAAAIYRLEHLDDDSLQTAIMRHAVMRGLSLEPDAARYLLKRVSRDPGELVGLLDRIDSYSLAAQRRVTIPLLREVISS
jgi:DnaA family protein